jgi:hypothetical protein
MWGTPDVMSSEAAVSISVHPVNRLASTQVSAGVRPKAPAAASAPSCASGGASMNTAATAADCSRVRVAAYLPPRTGRPLLLRCSDPNRQLRHRRLGGIMLSLLTELPAGLTDTL